MHAHPRTAPVPRPRLGDGAAGESSELFDWAVEEPEWAGRGAGRAATQPGRVARAAGGGAAEPDWWVRDRPILATVSLDGGRAPGSAASLGGRRVPGSAAPLGGGRASGSVDRLGGGEAAGGGGRAVGSVRASRGTRPVRLGRPAEDVRPGPEVREGGAVHLTRRGRLVVVGLIAAVLLGAFWVGTRAVSAASTAAGAESTYVQNGDTLWAVAERTRPEVDPRVTVARIRDLNGLEGTLVQPGQRLVLPAR
ncbi:MAG: LysM peptidoglycan-binding domain-containing protein [Streptosporangiales bacterium]|nr:LysM peptidoglycan-binding domain-containing protein [Streptosporangiales bacterium]